MATNRFVCEICHRGFQRDQNLQLHRRGHNLPWKLKQRTSTEIRKRVYVCPEPSCVHHHPERALGDLTGIKKHFSRKHGEKKWKCERCNKKYAVMSDWKAHLKTCGTREYQCHCGTSFPRRDSFITHRAFCEEGNETHRTSPLESAPCRQPAAGFNETDPSAPGSVPQHDHPMGGAGTMVEGSFSSSSSSSFRLSSNSINFQEGGGPLLAACTAHMSATALLQKAAQVGSSAGDGGSSVAPPTFGDWSQPYDGGQLFVNRFMSNLEPQDPIHGKVPQFFPNNWMAGNEEISNIAIYNALVDPSPANPLPTNTEVLEKKSSGSDTTTLDFLGVAGSSEHENRHSQRQQRRQRMEFDPSSHSALQGLNQFRQEMN